MGDASRSATGELPDPSDWMTIRVVLTGQPGHDLPHPPGRVVLAHADHAFADLAEALDTAFGRWDLTPLHRFEVDGRALSSPDAELPADDEDTDEVTLGEAGLRQGTRFLYVFDLDEEWLHDCLVEAVGVDPVELLDEEPDVPTPIDGWGVLPDQYGRLTEDDEGEAEDDEDEEEDWDAAEAASLAVVSRALAEVPSERDDAALAAVAGALRPGAASAAEPDAAAVDVLYAAADLDPADPPEDDEELWTQLAAAVVSPQGDVPLDDDAASAWASLEPADWAAAVIELVRGGPGTSASPEAVLDLIARCPEVEGDDLGEEDEALLLEGLEVVVALWRVLGVLDEDGALTELGAWGLPRALEAAWAPPET